MKFSTMGKEFYLNNKTLVMGILNVTPDSFSDGGEHNSLEQALLYTEKMLKDGADIIDIGGMSTRPGHDVISIEEEIARVIPVIKAISSRFDCLISIDTYRAEVAEQALLNGAHIINDIWGLQFDNGEMARVASKYSATVIAMHNQNNKEYNEDIILSIKKFFKRTFLIAEENGLNINNIIIDPGIGFGKGYDENILVLSRLEELTYIAPLLLGASRKKFIGANLNLEPKERVDGSISVHSLGVSKGAKIIRTHDVLEHVRAFSILDPIMSIKPKV